MRRIKIVCTLGPATSSEEAIERLVASGMDCARLNFSHGDHAGHSLLAQHVRRAAALARRPVAILADLCGPKMRVGKFEQGSIELVEGETFVLTTERVVGNQQRASVTYSALTEDAKPGDVVLLDDGLLRLRIREIRGAEVICKVEVGGNLSNNKGLNLPGTRLSAPALTTKDRADLAFAVETLQVDYIALSFVRRPDDVREAKALAGRVPVIAKLEKPEAIERLEEIVDAADGAMVARGDLGVELGSEKVPLIQKRIIRTVNQRGKIVITATQMLDSMMRNPRPTRAEAADVANAVLDGTDAVMLSGETAAGKYPFESLSMMDRIIQEVESQRGAESHMDAISRRDLHEWQVPNAAALAAALMSQTLPLNAVVTFTGDGRSADLLSEHRPRAPVVAITHDPRVASRLALAWGVIPRVEVPPTDLDETLRIASALLVREKLCHRGDAFAMVVAWPLSGHTNTVKLHWL